MKIAIVGTSIDLTDNEERDVRQLCAIIIKQYPINTFIVSGGAKGVDYIAIEVAKNLGYSTVVHGAEGQGWSYFKERNLIIAKECDKLFCISIPTRKEKCYHHRPKQDHEKTAGCWTIGKAKELGKECRLLVTPSR